jgi:glycosyltransferase involved in cell wall biosynthesis
MEKRISIVIPNFNRAETIGKCLEAALNSDYGNFEVIVVDDHSGDNSVEVISRFPCRLIQLAQRSGTSTARNTGARNSTGEIIFFTDSDCLLQRDTLSTVNDVFSEIHPGTVVGGTYTRIPYDKTFYSTFQSVFAHYFETKNAEAPDYIAAHAMIMTADVFEKSGGFPETFLPIIEDVELSHRLRASGRRLVMSPRIQVEHIFNFSLTGSLRNAVRKTMYWTMYSLKNRDLFADSGCASKELKINVASFVLNVLLVLGWAISRKPLFPYLLASNVLFNMVVNRGLFRAFYDARGGLFACLASLYYALVYPVPVGLGTMRGFLKHYTQHYTQQSGAGSDVHAPSASPEGERDTC